MDTVLFIWCLSNKLEFPQSIKNAAFVQRDVVESTFKPVGFLINETSLRMRVCVFWRPADHRFDFPPADKCSVALRLCQKRTSTGTNGGSFLTYSCQQKELCLWKSFHSLLAISVSAWLFSTSSDWPWATVRQKTKSFSPSIVSFMR